MKALELIQSKIFTKDDLERQLSIWRFKSRKIVFTNGCFDILHLGHIDYLSKASDEGDVLVIGVNTDESVSKLKGNHRPINNEEQRTMILASLHFVDGVILFGEETPYDLIKLVQPDVLIKGSDYKPEKIVGYDLVTTRGGQVKTIDYLPGYSTSLIEEKIRKGGK
ncbi:MAG: D-glycero-beta-D-manno-heptose 1-phosphate adenylyltransferase [Bacteroidetes bacterium]|nr:D-glycero-beta-D-manno-heptose 1-phosphate adenylyltransferase [Bacteroidota bacterium]